MALSETPIMANYIPRSDSEYTAWLTNFAAVASDDAAALGLPEDKIATIASALSTWQQAFEDYIATQATAQAALETRNDARRESESTIRALVRELQSNPNLTNTQRAALSITIPETNRSTAGIPSTQPIATIEQAGTLRHTIHFRDAATPDRRAKPKGIMGAEIYLHIGDPAPNDPGQFRFLGLDTRTPYTWEFDPDDNGKTAYYRLRWANNRGEQGPWSQQYSAPIFG